MERTLQERLGLSASLQEFLKGELTDGRRALDKKDHRKSYAAFARKAGFASRSYPREVCLGLKKITPKTIHGFISGFGLKGDGAKYFRDLAALDNPDLNFEKLNSEDLNARLAKLKKNLLSKKSKPVAFSKTSIFANKLWPYVFSALGSESNGSTIADVEGRLALPRQQVSDIITELFHAQMIRVEGEKVFPIAEKLIFKEEGREGAFKEFYLDTIKHAEQKARHHFKASDELYFNSVFSIPSSRLPEFKNELRSLLLNFIQDAEDPDGNSIVTLVTALTKSEIKLKN